MHSLRRRRNRRRRIWRVFRALIFVGLIAAVVFVVLKTNFGPVNHTQQTVETKKVPQPTKISSNVLFLGNTYWGRYINDWSMASPLKYAYPFSRLSEFERASYDAWISGLECPTKTGVSMSSATEDATLTFNCSPNYLPEAAKWFTAFTLANNHTDNQGADGFTETRQQLEANHIQYFGNPDPRVLDDICEVVSLPVTVTKDDSMTVKGKLPIAICAYHALFMLPAEDSVAMMAKYSPYMPVIAMPHMGIEYKTAPDQLKISFYRSLIDGGADMVLGDHPHWIQNTESYEGHLIVYSMGNFIFDQQDTSEVVRSAGIRVVMNTNDTNPSLLNKWLALGEKCGTFQDDCLTEAIAQHLQKLDISYQFAVIGTNDADKIVKPATVDQQNSILQRLNWQSTINQLQAPYSGL